MTEIEQARQDQRDEDIKIMCRMCVAGETVRRLEHPIAWGHPSGFCGASALRTAALEGAAAVIGR